MGRYSGKSCRLLCMLSLTLSFFLVEIITGYITNSLALIGDSYHMLSDVVALLVGFASVRISKWNTQKNTFGWARAEVLGALINSVFLIALCFTILIEALQRLYNTEEVQDPELMLIVGGIGLFVNLIGLALFAGHGHSHGGGGHGHSHGGGGHGHSHSKKNASQKNGGTAAKSATQQSDGSGGGGMAVTANGSVPNAAGGGAAGTESEASNPDAYTDHQHEGMDDGSDQEEAIMPTSTKIRSSAQLNMRGVFLHVLGDALGSVIVVISALMIKFIDAEWRFKVDPALSLVMVTIILSTTIPLLKESALILLQTVPTHITVSDLQDRLVQQVEGVMAVHEFHVWQLAGNRIIASAHIRCKNLRDYMLIAEQVKMFFHNEGIHSTTIQPEFAEIIDMERDCVLECGPDKTCFPDTCCASKKSPRNNGSASDDPPRDTLRQRQSAASSSQRHSTSSISNGSSNGGCHNDHDAGCSLTDVVTDGGNTSKA